MRRHFWLTLALMLALTGLAFGVSRIVTSYIRVTYLRSQAQFLTSTVLGQSGDPTEVVRQLQNRAQKLHVPYEFAVMDRSSPVQNEQSFVEIDDSESVVTALPNGKQLIVTVRPLPSNRPSAFITFIALVIAAILAALFSVVLLYARFREKAEVAKVILARMQDGDLKARLPTSRWDDFGQLPLLFNEMASDIESLVAQLRKNEKVRMELLQELAHDLRTPVSSLRNLIETLRFNGQDLGQAEREELMDLAYKEGEYLTRLVEDLLFLSFVLEPKYKIENSTVDLYDLVSSKAATVGAAYPKINANLMAEAQPYWVTGNTQHLRRLLRNALENAFSFATKKVEISLTQTEENCQIIIRDDGPGFSPEALLNFGHKRGTRYQSHQSQDRISVGLGSVIMSAIASGHGGQLRAENQIDEKGKILGSQLTLILPKPFLSTQVTADSLSSN